uniref:Zinc finger BED domain-containing protein RICESLEEPER 2-like n=1 Tax=Tanacetum cinerariifolium TaxID=118510 RepID=A0A6L2L374_TANCI|nr:zinc finger BED domain-containing protein RICESLEEPER 2-like [Tanacetum cinerariifolium]
MEPSGSETSEARSKDKGKESVIDVDSENVNQRVDEYIDKRVSDQVDEKKPRRFKSFVWDHFPRPKEGATETTYPYCSTVLAANSKQNGTSTLGNHLKNVCVISPLYRSKDKKKQTKLSFKPATMGESGVTVDNASSNDGAIRRLRIMLKGPNVILDCKYFHLRCCAHNINLVVKDGLEEQNSSICKIQNAVKYLRSSSGRKESFENVKFEKVFDRLELIERDYTSYFYNEHEDGEEGTRMIPKTKKKKKNVVGVPNEDDWSNARIFYDVTNKISGSKYLTSNMFVNDLVTMHVAISKMSRNADENKRKIALSMKSKYDKYWDNLDNMNVLLYVALVLDPRNKLKYLEFCLDIIYPKSRAETSNQGDQVSKRLKTLSGKTIEICKIVDDALKELYAHYKIKLDKQNDETFTVSSSSTHSEDDCSMKIDLDDGFSKYLRPNMVKFPILSQVAKHVLAMPISTVASKSTFSTGGRVIDKHRSSLTPKTAKTLICAQDWLRSTPVDLQDMPINGLPLEEMVDNLEKLELDMFSNGKKQRNDSSQHQD